MAYVGSLIFRNIMILQIKAVSDSFQDEFKIAHVESDHKVSTPKTGKGAHSQKRLS